jgi:signal peptidase I
VRTLLDWLITIGVAAGAVLAFEAEVATPYRVPSSSMEPTVHCARPGAQCEATFADRIIACRLCYALGEPQRKQIVVFHTPKSAAVDCGQGGTYVKRLIGLPGETIYEDANAYIWVNGNKLAEPYITPSARVADTKFRNTTWHVPKESYFMLGDNRSNSCDSRTWGSTSRSSLIGPVVATYWPPARIGATD